MEIFFDIIYSSFVKGISWQLFVFAAPTAILAIIRWPRLTQSVRLLLAIVLMAILWRMLTDVSSARHYAFVGVLSCMMMGAFPVMIGTSRAPRKQRLMLGWLICVVVAVALGGSAFLVRHSKKQQQDVINRELVEYFTGATFPALYDVSTNGVRFLYALQKTFPELVLLDPTHQRQEESRLVYSYDKIVFICKKPGDAESMKTRLRVLEPAIEFKELGAFPWGRRKSLFLTGIDNRAARAWGRPQNAVSPNLPTENPVCLLDFTKMPESSKNGDISPLTVHMPNCRRLSEARYGLEKDKNGIMALRYVIPPDGTIGIPLPLKNNYNGNIRGTITCRLEQGCRLRIRQYLRKDGIICDNFWPASFRCIDNAEIRSYTWDIGALEEKYVRTLLLVMEGGKGEIYKVEIVNSK